MNIHLASQSKTRAKLLKSAGIPFTIIDHGVDEDEIKLSFADLTPKDIVVKLAELKATQPSSLKNNDLVIGSDQVLNFKGKLINKAKDIQNAREQLIELCGSSHTLITSTIIAQNKKIIWRHLDQSILTMRHLSINEIDNYLNTIESSVLDFVGVYAIEQEGIKLFEKIDGDFFSIQGLSILPLINFLWGHNLILRND